MNARILLATALLLPAPASASPEFEAQLRREVERLRPVAAHDLQACEGALEDGWLLLALRELEAVHVRVGIQQYMDESRTRITDLAALSEEGKRVGEWLDETRRCCEAVGPPRTAALRSLAQRAWGRSSGHYRASLSYALSTALSSGQRYLGSARALADFAVLCTKFEVEDKGLTPLRLPAGFDDQLAAYLDEVENALLAAYRPPVSIDRHPEFINANATVKFAKELAAAGQDEGALYEALAARRKLALLQRDGNSRPDAASMRARIAELYEEVDLSGVDQSLGLLYLEMAEAELIAADDDKDLSLAAVLLEQVLPDYFALIGEE